MRGVTLREYERDFRSELDSESLNRNFRQIYDDLAEAFLRCNYVNSLLANALSCSAINNAMLAERIGELTSALSAYNNAPIVYWSAYDTSAVVSNIDCTHDAACGNVTLKWDGSWTKMQIITNQWGVNEAGNGVSIGLNTGGGLVRVTKPDSAYYMADSDPSTAWTAVYSTGAPSSIAVEVDVPPSMNPAINSLYIAPFPDGGPNISNIEYRTTGASWASIGGSFRSRSRLHFQPVDYSNAIRFVVSPVILDIGGAKYVFGVEDIDIGFIEYSSTGSIVVLLQRSDNIEHISSVNVDYSVTPAVSEPPVVIELYEDAGLTKRVYSSAAHGHPFSGTLYLTSTTNKLYAKFMLSRVNGTTPVIRGISVGVNV